MVIVLYAVSITYPVNIQTLFMTSQPYYIVSEFGVVYIFPVDSLGYSLSKGMKYKKLRLKFNIRNVKLIRQIVDGIHHIDIGRSIYSEKTTLSNACDVMCTHIFFIRGRRCCNGPCASVHYFTIN